MEELSLHILDIVENSIAAGARHVEIRVDESRTEDRLSVEIVDDGAGMSEATLRKATDPFFTTRTSRRVGLGLSLLEQAAKAAGGTFRIESQPGAGARVTAVFQDSHVDRQPLGDTGATLLALVTGNPEVEFSYAYRTDDAQVSFRTEPIKEQLGGMPVNTPEGIAAVRRALEKITEAALAATIPGEGLNRESSCDTKKGAVRRTEPAGSRS